MNNKMKINDFNININFYQIPKGIFNEKNLHSVDYLVYMLAYDNARLSQKNNVINQENEVYFYLTHENIQKKLNIGRNQSIASIKRLISANFIVADKTHGKATRYYLVNNFDNESRKNNPRTSKEKDTNFRPNQSENDILSMSEISDLNQSDFSDQNNNNINKNILNNNTKICVSQNELFEKFEDKICLLKNNSNISKFISIKNLTIFFEECSNEKILTKFFDILCSIETKVSSRNYFLGILKNLVNNHKAELYEETRKLEKKRAYNEKIRQENKIKEEQNELRRKQINDFDLLPEDIKRALEASAIEHLAKTKPSEHKFMNTFKDSFNSLYTCTIKTLAIEYMQKNFLTDLGCSLS